MPSVGVAAVAGGTTLLSGLIGSRSASGAAREERRGYEEAGEYQVRAAEIAADVQREQLEEFARQYDLARGDLAPCRETGAKAIKDLYDRVMAGPGEFMKSPGYDFLLREGEQAINRLAASRGRYFSGGTGRELLRYGTGLAQQDYQNWFNRYLEGLRPLQSLAGVGQTSAAQTGQLGAQYGGLQQQGVNALTSLITGAGAARGAAAIGAGGAQAGGAINQANLGMNMLNQALAPYLMWKMGAFNQS